MANRLTNKTVAHYDPIELATIVARTSVIKDSLIAGAPAAPFRATSATSSRWNRPNACCVSAENWSHGRPAVSGKHSLLHPIAQQLIHRAPAHFHTDLLSS